MRRYIYFVILNFVHQCIHEAVAVADLSDFFPYGDINLDTPLFRNDDQSSTPQNISVEFTFFTERHSQLYVNTNGLVSFKQGISVYNSEPFPQIGTRTVLSPFWTDIDTRYCGPDCNIWYRESMQHTDLQKATFEIRKYFPVMKHFEATWTYIVTWYDVARFGTSGNETEFRKRNTFQAVLITDSESTFVIYYYNKIEWTGTIPAQVGFNMGDNIHFFSVEGSRTETIINLPQLTNVNVPGTFAFRVDLKDVHQAPPSGDSGKCYLKPSDLVLVVDLSLSINKTTTKKLMKELIDYIPINEYEFQVGMTTFSEKVKREFYFDDSKSTEDIKNFIDELDVVSSTSDLTKALVSTKQMFMYNYRGCRSYAKKFALIFTDGLMPEGTLITDANNLKSVSTVIMVGIGTSVQHSLLDKLATDKTVFSPNAEKIWTYLQLNLARPSCLVCATQVNGDIFIILDDSSRTTIEQFMQGKHFVTDFLTSLTEIPSSSINVSIDLIGRNHTSVFPIQSIANFKERMGVLTMTDYRGGLMDLALLEQFAQNLLHQSADKGIFIIVSSGYSLKRSLLTNLKSNINTSKLTLMTVGLGRDTNWDNLEYLASNGYFVFDRTDGLLAAKHLANELRTVACT